MTTLPSASAPAYVSLSNGRPVTTSLRVAETFEKLHKNVLQSIEDLKAECPASFTELNFQPSEYTDPTGRKLPMVELTRDAFTLLAMGFTGPKAMGFKLDYIDAFNQMEAALRQGPTTTPALPSDIHSHFQGGRWLVHMDQRGNLIFNPVDCEAFHVPAREFPAVISSAEFPSSLLPMVLSAVSERMRRTGGLLQGDVRSEPRPPVLSAAPRLSVLPETNRPAQPQASRSRRPVTQRTTPLPARREYPPPFTMKKDFVEAMLEMVQGQKANELAAKLRIDSRWCHQVIVYVKGKSRVTTAEVVAELHEEGTDQNKRRAGRILKALGFFGRRAYQGGKSFRVYVRGGQS